MKEIGMEERVLERESGHDEAIQSVPLGCSTFVIKWPCNNSLALFYQI